MKIEKKHDDLTLSLVMMEREPVLESGHLVLTFFFFFFGVFQDKVLLCSLGCPATNSVDSEICLPLPQECWD